MRARSRRAGLALAAGVLLAGAPALALDPRRAITQYSHRIWQTDHGLPQDTVDHVIQTRDGYLWIATQEGSRASMASVSPSSTSTRRPS